MLSNCRLKARQSHLPRCSLGSGERRKGDDDGEVQAITHVKKESKTKAKRGVFPFRGNNDEREPGARHLRRLVSARDV
jgi:hypothetical protein